MALLKPRKMPKIPISAMSDIAFLLLIFIMLVSLIDYRQEVKIAYPESVNPELTQVEANLEIWIDAGGDLYVDGVPTARDKIEDRIVHAFLDDPATRIHVIADRRTSYRHVHEVVDILQLLQHRVVSFVVQEAER